MKTKFHSLLVVLALLASGYQADAQGTAFTYQGRLTDNGAPANSTYDFSFFLYDASSGGTQLSFVLRPGMVVSNGLFTAVLDFGNNFPGADRWLEIKVGTNTLVPRQKLTPAPYAITAGSVVSGGLPAGTYTNTVYFTSTGNLIYGDFIGIGGFLTQLNASQLTFGTVPDARLSANIARTNQVWLIDGNAGTSDDFIGTVDNTTFNIRVNNARVMRYRLTTDAEGTSTNAPNVIGGSSVNSASDTVVGATIAGGGGDYSPDGTANANKVTADFGTVGGGEGNTASGDDATVSGGEFNIASGFDATVCGGAGNTASDDDATVCGGIDNTASGNDATVCGGGNNIASGDSSFAAGSFAQAKHNGSFVWADASDFAFSSTTANQFRVRATGGVAFVTAIDGSGNFTAGVHLLAGDTAWSSISDKNAKKNFQLVDGEAILDKLTTIPVEKWNYKWEADTNTPHIGPMAQDFKGAFYPGRDDKSITTLEFDGVELAAIQGLNQKLEETRAENAELKHRLEMLEKIILNQKSN